MAVWKLPKLPSGRHRNNPWRAKVKGEVEDFPTRKSAEYWQTKQLESIATRGLPLTFEALKKVTVGEIVERYLKDKTPHKGSAASETTQLEKLLGFKKGQRDPARERHPICALSLAAVKRTDGFSYRDERLKAVTRGSVKREFATLHNIFEVAKEEWGYENLTNPFDGMKLKENPARQRVLKPGELERLEQEAGNCRGLNRHYMLIAIHLAIETGMRQQEIFNLTWADVDLEKRLITIRKSKTDHKSEIEGRTIVMSFRAAMLLTSLRLDLKGRGRYSEQNRIFPMTKGAIKQSFSELCKRAEVADFQFRDFRHEAASWFDRAGLTHAEHGLMMGHGKRTMRDRYITADLQSIQNKIDRYVLGGKTLEEFTGLGPHQSAVALDALLKEGNRVWNKARKSGEPIEFGEALKQARADLLSQSAQQETQETSAADSEKVIVLATRKQSAMADKKMGA